MRLSPCLVLFKKVISISILMCALFPVATSAAYQSHESIYYAARNYVKTHVVADNKKSSEVKVGKLDSRLKLKKCSKYLKAFMPKGSRSLGKTTVGVRCEGTNPWSLQVPVTIKSFKHVLVAARQLQKGSVLQSGDVKLKKLDVSTLSYGFMEDVKRSEGLKLKRRVLSGAVITPAMLKKPQVISRGQQVTIMAQSGRMQVRMEGKALANGAVGERIRVMNLKSRQKLEGVITPAGEVKVDI